MDWEESTDSEWGSIVPRKAIDVMIAYDPYPKPTQVGRLSILRGAR